MRKGNKTRSLIRTISNFFIFFLLAAFVTTCCIMLFVTALQDTLGRNFTQDEITLAAKITVPARLINDQPLSHVERKMFDGTGA